MTRQLFDQTIASLELEKKLIEQSIVKLKALRDATTSKDTPHAEGR